MLDAKWQIKCILDSIVDWLRELFVMECFVLHLRMCDYFKPMELRNQVNLLIIIIYLQIGHSHSGLFTVISKYRNKLSVTDFSLSGLITGALYKTSLGPKGMFSGGFFGGLLGTFYGAFAVGVLKLSGGTMHDVYDACHFYFRQKDRWFHGAYKVSAYRFAFEIWIIFAIPKWAICFFRFLLTI